MKSKNEINNFSDKQKLREFIVSGSSFQKNIMEVSWNRKQILLDGKLEAHSGIKRARNSKYVGKHRRLLFPHLKNFFKR